MPTRRDRTGKTGRLRDQADKARRLARTVAGDRVAKWLEEIADELEKEAKNLEGDGSTEAGEH